ncbi:MAG: pyridoxamine 5'-phosphate oxidase family protein [Bacilli bacterium]|nr:pyridoxamine 5'-phosphate oxidase family protein [Bacilli bacterium]
MEDVQKFLKDCGIYYLATIDNNKPKVRPFGTAEIYEGHLYIQTGKKKDVYKQIEKNNNVEICAFKDSKWIRVSGNLILDNRIEAKKDMLDKNPNLRGMYNENDDNTAVLYFEHAKAVISSFGEEPKKIEF